MRTIFVLFKMVKIRFYPHQTEYYYLKGIYYFLKKIFLDPGPGGPMIRISGPDSNFFCVPSDLPIEAWRLPHIKLRRHSVAPCASQPNQQVIQSQVNRLKRWCFYCPKMQVLKLKNLGQISSYNIQIIQKIIKI